MGNPNSSRRGRLLLRQKINQRRPRRKSGSRAQKTAGAVPARGRTLPKPLSHLHLRLRPENEPVRTVEICDERAEKEEGCGGYRLAYQGR